jgi:uncharacterized protein (DUF2267 family)
MEFDQFVGKVQQKARLSSGGEAVQAIRATLVTLGERLPGGAAENLAAQLPREIGFYLTKPDTSDSFDLDEFLTRVAEKEAIDKPDSVYHARAVIEVLQEAVAPQALNKVKSNLPDDFNPLFEAGSTGQIDND